MRSVIWIPIASLLVLAAACDKKPASSTAPEASTTAAAPAAPLDRPELTVKDIMDSMVDPSGDYLFESVQDIADKTGAHRKEPRTAADWATVKKHWQVLYDAPALLIQPGRKAGRPEDKPAHPEVENPPEEVQKLLDAQHPDFVIRAQRLKDVASQGIKAADAKDVAALSTALLALDKACESCHLHYFYPNDQRAHQAAKEDGVIE